MGFVTGMLAGMLRRNIDPAPCWPGSTSILQTRPAGPLDRYARLYNLVIRELDDEGFGLFAHPWGGQLRVPVPRHARRPDPGRRPRPGPALPRHRAARPGGEHLRSGHRAELRITETRPWPRPDDPARVFAFEWLLRLLHSLSCWLVGRGLALDSVDFPFARPAHADDYALVYTERSAFIGGRVLTARFNATLLDLPIRRDEAALASFLDGAPGRISMLYRRDRATVTGSAT
jgi:hypothetical protein